MKKNVSYGIHAAVLAVSVILAVASSFVAYPMSDLKLTCGYGIAAVVLDLVMLLVLKKDNVCFCHVLAGRADLMGYIWFSDLEAGNPTAVASLNLGTVSMAGFLICAIMIVILGFRKEK